MRNVRHSALVVVALALGLLGLGAAAWSFWSSSGAGAADAAVGTLDPPSGVSGSPSGSTVALDWTGPAAPGGGPVDGYFVQRSPGTPGGTCASSPSSLLPATPTSCSDTALPSGTYTYTVVAVFRSWTASAGSGPVSVATDHFQVAAPAAAPAGSAFDVTVTAQDAPGATDATYTGAKTLVWSGPGPAPSGTAPSYPASGTFTNGVGSASITLFRAGTATLTATQGTVTGTSAGIVVSPGTATRFASVACSPQVAGSPFDAAVTAQDAFENTAPTFAGVQSLVWSGPGPAPDGSAPGYPASVTFTNGVGTASITLVKAEATTLTATQASITGTSAAIVVEPGTATRFAVAAATPQTAGSPFSVAVTAQDAFRNTATAYAGTVQFSSTDAQAVLQANYTFVAADAGTRTFAGGATRCCSSPTASRACARPTASTCCARAASSRGAATPS